MRQFEFEEHVEKAISANTKTGKKVLKVDVSAITSTNSYLCDHTVIKTVLSFQKCR